MKSAWMSIAALAALVALASCSSDGDSGPAQGTERGACYGNLTCNAGLSCLSNVCVNASGAGASNGGGGGAAGDTDDEPSDRAGASGNEGGASGAATALPPTQAALRVSWTLREGASGDALSCDDAGGNVGIIATNAADATDFKEVSFPCADNEGDIELEFGTYSVDVSLRTSGLGLVKGSAPLLKSLLLADSPCDAIETDHCVTKRAVVITVDN